MPELSDTPQPPPTADERELLLGWLDHLRTSILRKLDGLSEDQVRWTPDEPCSHSSASSIT
jgi:hypothetical protein